MERVRNVVLFPAKILSILTIPPTSKKDADSFGLMIWPYFGIMFTAFVLSYGKILGSVIAIIAVSVFATLV